MTRKSYVALGRSWGHLRVRPCLFCQLGKPVWPSFPTYPQGHRAWMHLPSVLALLMVCAASESHFPPLNIPLCIYNMGTLKCRCHNHLELPAQAATASLLVILILQWPWKLGDIEAALVPGAS